MTELNTPELLVWRGQLGAVFHKGDWHQSEEVVVPDVYDNYVTRCPFCQNSYHQSVDIIHEHEREDEIDDATGEKVTCLGGKLITQKCKRCGFWHSFEETVCATPGQYIERIYLFANLRIIDINEATVVLEELGSHLKRRYSDRFMLTSRQFERLVEDVYSHLGYRTRLTQQTWDDGYDVVLLERSSGEQILVECKRYTTGHNVGVNVVRQILGVQLVSGVHRAKIVTTTRFTDPAKDVSETVNQGVSGYELELVDADRFLRHLEVYNTELPPLKDQLLAWARQDSQHDSNHSG